MFTSNASTAAALVALTAAAIAPKVEAGIVTQDRLSANTIPSNTYRPQASANLFSEGNTLTSLQAGLAFSQTLDSVTSGGIASFQMHASIMQRVPGARYVAPADLLPGGQYANESWGTQVSFWDRAQFNPNNLSQGFLGSSIQAASTPLSLVTTLNANNPTNPQHVWNISSSFVLPQFEGQILIYVTTQFGEAANFRYQTYTTVNSANDIIAEGARDNFLGISPSSGNQFLTWPTGGIPSLQERAAIRMEIQPVPAPGPAALGLAGLTFAAWQRRRSLNA